VDSELHTRRSASSCLWVLLVWLPVLLLPPPTAADLLLFESTLTLNGLDPATVAATGTGVATVNGSGGGLHLSTAGIGPDVLMANTTSTPTSPPTSFPFEKIAASFSNAAGAFAVTTPTGLLKGPMALPGNVELCVDIGCEVAYAVPFTEGGSNGVGVGGSTVTTMVGSGTTISLRGAGWQSGSVTITTVSGTHMSVGFVHGPASLTSSTAITNGVLQLVTPIAITASTTEGPVEIPLFGSLQLRFVPEPASGAALLAGAAAIALLGRWNRRRA